jgi:hypothetical protein
MGGWVRMSLALLAVGVAPLEAQRATGTLRSAAGPVAGALLEASADDRSRPGPRPATRAAFASSFRARSDSRSTSVMT